LAITESSDIARQNLLAIDDTETKKNLKSGCLGILGAGEIHIVILTATSETDQTPAAIMPTYQIRLDCCLNPSSL